MHHTVNNRNLFIIK